MDRKIVASGVLEALEDADRVYRNRPDFSLIFQRVDRIKADPNRGTPTYETADLDSTLYRIVECAWCGDNFVARRFHGRWTECCSKSCVMRIRLFRRAREA